MSSSASVPRRKTRLVRAGTLEIGAGRPIVVQSMCATHTRDVPATLAQIAMLQEHGAGLIRVAVDGPPDVEALREIRKRTDAALVVDIQESFRLVPLVAPLVQKIRYNPGHLHHHQKNVPVKEKVRTIVDAAKQHGLALRIGINFGSIDPARVDDAASSYEAALQSAREHIAIMEQLEFENFVVSLKSSDPNEVVAINRAFAEEHPEVPIHLGVTEAGMLPMGEVKSRAAFESLLQAGIGDTLRVSLTLPFSEKYKEVEIGKRIIEDVYAGRAGAGGRFEQRGLNIISCPSCSRVENEAFIELAAKVKELTRFAAEEQLTIAVMGCRVNGPGETDDADLGLWCAPKHVNLKRKSEVIGAFSYEEVLPRLEQELRAILQDRKSNSANVGKNA